MSSGVKAFQLFGEIALNGTDEVKKDLKDVSKEGEETKKSVALSFEDMGAKAGELGSKMALGLAGIATSFVALVEGTKEFRQDLGKLETSFDLLAEGGAKQGTQTFKELYAVLGEDDTAIEAANNLVALTGETESLNEWTNILTGVYASFGDSLPIEGLAEAANETARTGSVTGGLADAINWAAASGETFGVKLKANTKANKEWNDAVKSATTAEEFFNLALQDCATASDREKLIRETLNGLYGESAEVYKENNKSVMDNNTAQAEMNLKMAEAAEKIEPFVTQGKILLAEVLEKLTPFLTFIIDNMSIIAPIVLGFLGTLFALSIASKVKAFIPVVKTLNATLKANPIGLVITAIGLLVTAFITLWTNCEGFRNFWIKLWEKLKSAFNTAVDGIKKGINNVKNFFSNMKNSISNTINGIKNSVSNVFNKIKDSMSKPVEKARDTIKSVIDKIKGIFNFKWSLPHLKLPHIKVSGGSAPFGIGGKGSLPKFDIEWYKKAMDKPMILNAPTAFGISPNGKIRAGGEAGSELVGGTDTVMNMISNAVRRNNGGIEAKLDRLISLLANYLPIMSNQQVVLSTGELVGALTSPLDKSLGELADNKRRGR